MSFAIVSALCVWMGFYATFNSFGAWDDEGTLLSALKLFAHHGGLYTHVSSPFGPVYFEAFSAVFSWLPLNLDVGRLTTLAVTLLTSLGFGVAIKMMTRSLIAGIATQAGTFMVLILSFAGESMHPSLMVSFLFAVALIALALVARGQRSTGCMLLGATLAGLVLTIVNVGAFAAIAFLFTGLALAQPLRQLRLPRAAAAALFIVTPFLVVLVSGGQLTDSWIAKYALIVTISAAGIVVVTLDRDLQGLVHGRDAYRFLLGGGVMGLLVIVIALITGTQPLDLIRGLVPNPTLFGKFTVPLAQSWWTEAWALVCLGGAVLYRRHRNRNSPPSLLDVWAHVAVGFLILYVALQQGTVYPGGLLFPASFTMALPLLFFAAIPPVGATDSERLARVGVVALALVESFVAYPVAGSQIRWSTVLVVPVGVLCFHDGIHELHPDAAVMRRIGHHAVSSLLAVVVVVGGLVWLASFWHGDLAIDSREYHANTPLRLPGSHLIRIPYSQAATLSTLTQAIRMQCSTFVAVPEMNSFYFWTGESPPTDDWLNSWFYLAGARLQTQVVHRIEGQDRSRFCVLVNPTLWADWDQGHPVPQLPLAQLVERFKQQNGPPASYDGYQLFVVQDSSWAVSGPAGDNLG